MVRPAANTFEPEAQAALALLANAVAAALGNARLVETGRIQAERSATQAERERLAAELHDNLPQALSFLNLKADLLENCIAADRLDEAIQVLAEVCSATTRASGQVRTVLTELHTALKAQPAFAADLRACITEIQAMTGMTIAVHIEDAGRLTLSSLAHQQALHIVREALTNYGVTPRQVMLRFERSESPTACASVCAMTGAALTRPRWMRPPTWDWRSCGRALNAAAACWRCRRGPAPDLRSW